MGSKVNFGNIGEMGIGRSEVGSILGGCGVLHHIEPFGCGDTNIYTNNIPTCLGPLPYLGILYGSAGYGTHTTQVCLCLHMPTSA